MRVFFHVRLLHSKIRIPFSLSNVRLAKPDWLCSAVIEMPDYSAVSQLASIVPNVSPRRIVVLQWQLAYVVKVEPVYHGLVWQEIA